MTVTFESTNTKIEITRWYSITGAPIIRGALGRTGLDVLPTSAQFIFVDGEFSRILVSGRIVKKDGSPSDRVVKVPEIYHWNQYDWPDWLKRLRDLAFYEFVNGVK